LKQYHWPGNVRELQNVMERIVIMSGDRISTLDLPEEIIGTTSELSSGISNGSALKEFRDKAEREFIIGTLKKNSGNISQSAIELGVRRTYLHRRLVILGIAKKDWFS
jgi:transcriptional regulator of acetoin/glycerol metabolism